MKRTPLLLTVRACCAALLFGCAADAADAENTQGGAAREEEKGNLQRVAQSLSVVGCDNNQLWDITFAWSDAQTRAGNAIWHHAFYPNHANVVQHFGGPNPYIGTVLANVWDRLNSADVTLICDNGHPSCGPGFIARAQGDNDVRLCAPYWSQDWNGKIQTLLHEFAHHSGAPADDDGQGVTKNAYRYEGYYAHYSTE